MKTHKRQWKEKQVQELKQLFDKYPVVGVADVSATPASLVQKLRKNLHGKAELRLSKTRIIKRALDESASKKTIESIVNKSCLVVFTRDDPFEVFNLIKKNRVKSFAKAGYIAEDDIIVPAGDTGLPPGPALSDLKAAGLAIKIQGPTISVTADKVVAKKGEAVTPPVANVLSKLDIKPVKIGLKMVAFYKDGVFFKPEVLDIDSEKIFNDFANAYNGAVNLSFNAGIINNVSLPLLLGKAFRDSKEVALEAKIFTGQTMPAILEEAIASAKNVGSNVSDSKTGEQN